MEHKLVRGGSQYLPFARSRIKALQASGQRYASQKFVFPDALVKVKIADDQEYIEISGESVCLLNMDSGIVDILSIGSADPRLYLPGILHETEGVARYNAPFTFPSEDAPWRLNPEEAGQLSGSVSGASTFTGRVPADLAPARSFSPVIEPVSPATDPPTWQNKPDDGALAYKKTLAILCPASVFTGRCRLWIQAVYGRHSNEYVGNSVKRTPRMPELVAVTSAAPALRFPSWSAPSEPASSERVFVDTSCGVWLDPATGKHWLFQPHETSVTVYPLIADPCRQALRKFLITADQVPGIEPLNDLDREHLEAYILSGCLPHFAGAVAASGSHISAGRFSMGYGWHWNWSGTRADMVVNDTFQQDGENKSAMRSTHYRITITHNVVDGVDQWTATQTVLEGPTDWAVQRNVWTIAEPDFGDMGLIKTTPGNSMVFACNAPFYAFYVRDELKVCRVQVVIGQGHSAEVIYDNCYGENCVTMGLNEGSRTQSASSPNYFSAIFTCGGESTPPIPYGKYIDYPSITEVKDKVVGEWRSGFGGEGYGSRNFEISDDYGGGRHFITESSGLIDDRSKRLIYFNTIVSSRRDDYYGQATVVVPLYDAEAIYLQSRLVTEQVVYANTTIHLGNTSLGPPGFILRMITDVNYSGYSFASAAGCFPADGHEEIFRKTVIPDRVITVTHNAEVLVCHAGAVPATFTHLNELHNDMQDEVGDGFNTYSGTSTDFPVVIAPGHADAVGVITGAAAPVLVGWI